MINKDQLLDINSIWDGVPVHYIIETISTMDVAAQMAREDAEHMTTVCAEVQTKGRGRRGREWDHFSGSNLAFTCIVRCGIGVQLPLVASLAICKGLQQFVDTNLQIKWPNDIMMSGKKIGGVLVEKQKDIALLGVGINVKTPPQTLKGFLGIALESSCYDKYGDLKREDVFSSVLKSLVDAIYVYEEKGWNAFSAEYEEACLTIGQNVEWQNEEYKLHGKAIGLIEDGTLEIKTADGKVYAIHAGDIIAQGQNHN